MGNTKIIQQVTTAKAFLILLLISANAVGQVSSLTIEMDSLVYSQPNNTITVSYTFCNGSRNALMAYGLTARPGPVPFNLSRLCDIKDIGTGIAFAIYNANGKQEMYEIVIGDTFGQKPVTNAMLDSALKASNERFRKTKKILLSNDKISFTNELNVKAFYLEPGLYYLELVYYCGDRIFNALTVDDLKKSNAKLYQGCTMSNKIAFTVN